MAALEVVRLLDELRDLAASRCWRHVVHLLNLFALGEATEILRIAVVLGVVEVCEQSGRSGVGVEDADRLVRAV